jgi:hypothetical protein
MKKSIVSKSAQMLDLLPFAQLLTREKPSPKLLAAASIVTSPIAKRIAPRITGLAQVVVAGIALVSLANSLRRRPGFKWRPR